MPSAIDEAERISEPSRKQSRYGSKAMIEIDEMMPLASIAEAMPLIEHRHHLAHRRNGALQALSATSTAVA